MRVAKSIRTRSDTSSIARAPSPTKSITEGIGRSSLGKPTIRQLPE
jgi:hypothetical protein